MLIRCDVQAKALLEVKPQMDAAGVNLMALSVGGSSTAHQCGALILSASIRNSDPIYCFALRSGVLLHDLQHTYTLHLDWQQTAQ